MKFFLLNVIAFVVLVSCGGSSSPTADTGGKNKGEKIYNQLCTPCHGTDGKQGVSGAKDLSVSPMSLDERIRIITDGKTVMPAYKTSLSEEEIKAVAEYTLSLKQ